jgi:uncharacterized protein (TIGR03435 family)
MALAVTLAGMFVVPLGYGVLSAAPRIPRAAVNKPATAQVIAAPAFEVASIRPNVSGDDGTMRNLGAGGRLVLVNFTLRDLITTAYDVAPFQVTGGPPWINRNRFDVTAKASTAAPLPELYVMLRQLLAERFKLAVRFEERELPRYRLTRVRDNGGLGPALKPSTVDCGPTGLRDRGPGGPAGPADDCHRLLSPARIELVGQRIGELVKVLEMILERPIVDATELTGAYDIVLSFPAEAVANTTRPSDLGPALITALQEQLGLKVEAQRGPVRVIFVESAEPPTEN